jgi:hypothetical protein
MKRKAAEILRNALALPTEVRAALAGSLLDSLDTDVDDNSQAAWATELNRFRGRNGHANKQPKSVSREENEP